MKQIFELETYTNNVRIIGMIAIAICIAAWAVEIASWVYVCPFCRVQRTVIGLLGLLLLFPNPGHWISRYVGSVLGVLGLVVGATQNFRGWAKISSGEFVFNEKIYIDSFLLSGAAMFIITGLVFLLFLGRSTQKCI